MALIATLVALSLSAHPARLVLGKDAGAVIEIDGAPAGARVTLSTSAGTVGEARPDGDVLRARFTPPALKSPSVALVLAQVESGGSRELAWLSIPLWGADTMEIETRPGSHVEADVAGSTIGPVLADKKGIARLPMVVPPGVNRATLHIKDPLGNATEKSLDLDPPPFSRVRMAARSGSASAAAPLEVEIFVVKPDGTPDDHADLDMFASGGGDADVRKRIGHGVYLARYSAPPGKTGTARLETKANGQLSALEVPVGTARVSLAQPFWQSALAPQQPWSVALGVIGGVGSTFAGATEGTAMLEAAMRLEVLPLEALVEVGWSFFSEESQYGQTPTNAERAKAQSRYAQVGVRLGKQLARGLDGHASLLFGYQSQVVGVHRPTGVFVAQDAWTPRAAFALGASLRLGPGRALAQVQLDASASGIAGLEGSLGGVQFMAGYLVTVY